MKFDDLEGKVAVITGGARGLGYSLAEALAAQGCSVALLDILDDVKESGKNLAADYSVRTFATHVDVTDADSVARAFNEVRHDLGVPQILITAAGITIWNDSASVSAEEWRKVMAVNLDGTFFAAQAFGQNLLEVGLPGSAVLISSMSGSIVNVPQHQASYNTSKAAVTHLAKSLGVEWARAGVRVNAIAPGYFLSQMTRQFTEANPGLTSEWVSRIPAARLGKPEDLHGLVLFLASGASSYITAQNLVIDGGYTAI